jgi:hypothetical protein
MFNDIADHSGEMVIVDRCNASEPFRTRCMRSSPMYLAVRQEGELIGEYIV